MPSTKQCLDCGYACFLPLPSGSPDILMVHILLYGLWLVFFHGERTRTPQVSLAEGRQPAPVAPNNCHCGMTEILMC